MFTKSDLKLLNSSKGLGYLLQSEKLDFNNTLRQLRFEAALVKLQIKLIKIQNKVVEKGKRLLILVEGREFAGKGSLIDMMTEHLNPRSIRMVALNKPTAQEEAQWYFKRYIEQLPEAGEMVFFDRSWYNRAMVEPVNGFCSQKEYKRFMKEVIHFERMLIEDGIQLIKIYFSISKKEQQKRIEEVRQDPLRRWELSPIDLQAVSLWSSYTKYEKALFELTNTEKSPWLIFNNDELREGSLEAFRKILTLLK